MSGWTREMALQVTWQMTWEMAWKATMAAISGTNFRMAGQAALG